MVRRLRCWIDGKVCISRSLMQKCVAKCVVDWREDRLDTCNDEEMPMWLRMCDHMGNFYMEFCPVPVRLENCGRWAGRISFLEKLKILVYNGDIKKYGKEKIRDYPSERKFD